MLYNSSVVQWLVVRFDVYYIITKRSLVQVHFVAIFYFPQGTSCDHVALAGRLMYELGQLASGQKSLQDV